MKKLWLLIVSFVLILGLAACGNGGNDDPDPVDFSIALDGVVEELEINVDDAFNVYTGITAMGSDGVDYVDQIVAESETCEIADNGDVDTSTTAECVIEYSIVIQGKVARATLNLTIKVEADTNAPLVAG